MITTERIGDHVAVVTLSRPERLNAVDPDAAASLSLIIDELEEDADIRCWVLTGTGRAFCAGADLKALSTQRARRTPNPSGFAGLTRRRRTTPVVAAVNGLARGAGVEFMLACDLAVLATDATLGLPETSRGMMAAEGGLVRLARALPPPLAAEMTIAGRVLTAAEALQFGLANAVVEADRVLEVALDLARRVAANAPLAVSGSLEVLTGAAWAPGLEDAWRISDERTRVVNASEDAREGARAFAERRPPVWRGESSPQ